MAGGGDTPDLGPDWVPPSPPVLVLAGGRQGGTADLGPDWGTHPPPLERTWAQRLGYPLPPKRGLEPEAGRGPGTRDWGTPSQ